MQPRTIISAAVATIALSAPLAAASLTDTFTSFYVFGDSLSDDGSNVGLFTDGTVWATPILDEFDAAGLDARNFAHGGANLLTVSPEAIVLDMEEQIGAFATHLALNPDPTNTNMLASVWIGGNDVVPAVLGAYDSAASLFGFSSAVDLLAGAYKQSLEALIGLGVDNFLVFDIPDVGDTPLVRRLTELNPPAPGELSLSQGATLVTQAINSAFDMVRDAIVDAAPDNAKPMFFEVSAFALSDDLRSNPALFGASAAGPCQNVTFGGQVIQLASGDPCSETTYWDGFHPTGNVHAFIETEVRSTLQPIPLPAAGWLLIGGLGGLALLRRRAATA